MVAVDDIVRISSTGEVGIVSDFVDGRVLVGLDAPFFLENGTATVDADPADVARVEFVGAFDPDARAQVVREADTMVLTVDAPRAVPARHPDFELYRPAWFIVRFGAPAAPGRPGGPARATADARSRHGCGESGHDHEGCGCGHDHDECGHDECGCGNDGCGASGRAGDAREAAEGAPRIVWDLRMLDGIRVGTSELKDPAALKSQVARLRPDAWDEFYEAGAARSDDVTWQVDFYAGDRCAQSEGSGTWPDGLRDLLTLLTQRVAFRAEELLGS